MTLALVAENISGWLFPFEKRPQTSYSILGYNAIHESCHCYKNSRCKPENFAILPNMPIICIARRVSELS